MSVEIIALLTILLLFTLFSMGMELGFAMTLVGIIGFAVVVGPQAAFDLVAIDFYTVFSSYSLIVIPVFVLMGQFGANAGEAKQLYDLADKWVGHISGGLAIATIVAGTAFKAICGSAIATSATFATIAIPEMDRYGYAKKLSCGTTATVGTLGSLLPPSVGLILYGYITNTSISRMFLAGIIPGLILSATFASTLFFWCKIDPKLGPKGEKSTWKQKFVALPPAIPVIVIFVLVVGGMMWGFFSPTEAGSVGALGVLLLVVAKREMDLRGAIKSVMESVKIGCMVLTMIAGATVFGHFFAITNLPFMVAGWLSGLQIWPSFIIMIILVVYLIGGSIIDDVAFFILATPIFFPIAMKLGYDPIWFGIVLSVTMAIGIIIPPIAINVFVVSGIAKVPLGTVYKGIYPFLAGMVLVNLAVIYVPQLSLWLPKLLMP
jgi:tripartite ATP-independent transporter DctM subunit